MLNDSRANKRIYQHVTHLSEVILPEPEQGAHSQTRRPCVRPRQRGRQAKTRFQGGLKPQEIAYVIFKVRMAMPLQAHLLLDQ
jgi:hypothetical protein